MWFLYMKNVAEWTCFPNPQIETHLKVPTLKHIGVLIILHIVMFISCI